MQPAACNSFDVAFWFLDRARAEDTYMQPRKLQCLLFLAQGHFIAIDRRRRLMPSVFLFDEGGPIDPNLYRAFEHGRPPVSESALSEEVLAFLDSVWKRYAACETLRLDQIIARLGAAEPCIRRRDGSEVGLAAMRRMFAAEATGKRPATPRVMRAHDGRPVTVRQWMPTRKTPVT